VPAQAADNTVKVFILAGQSNMEGKARNTLLDYQALIATRPQFDYSTSSNKSHKLLRAGPKQCDF
jgi:hypothetical protein